METIHVDRGKKVVFHGLGGYHCDRIVAYQQLNVGHIYTVDKTVVDNWHTDVFLIEVPGISFNSVLFDEIIRGGDCGGWKQHPIKR